MVGFAHTLVSDQWLVTSDKYIRWALPTPFYCVRQTPYQSKRGHACRRFPQLLTPHSSLLTRCKFPDKPLLFSLAELKSH